MNRIKTILIFLIICQIIAAQKEKVFSDVHDKLLPAHSAIINGHIGNKLNASYNNRILAQDVDVLIHPFTIRDEHSCWQGEFWGKWFTSAALAYKYKPTTELLEVLKKAAYGLIETQTSDGYIGNYAPESHLKAWDIWGRKYVILGLIAFYDISKDKKVLDAASKEADFLIKELNEKESKIIKMGNHRGMAASSVLEPMTQLYVRTGNKTYLDFAEEIVRQWELPEGPQLISKSKIPVGKRFPKPAPDNWYGWEQGQKAYEMMSCYEGLLELYRLTGKEEYKTAVENTWQSIIDSEINIAGSGASVESWFSGKDLQQFPIEHYQETCVTVTWLKLNQQLLRLTGETKYADAIEQTFYNALLGSMRPDGSDWAKYTPLSGQRLKGSEQCGMGLNCCNASGPRGLFTIPLTAVMQSNEGATVNFFIDGEYEVMTPKKAIINLMQQTKYPVEGKVDIKLEMKKSETMTLAFRVPSWCEKVSVMVNGEAIQNTVAGGYLKINRLWKDNDSVSINFDLKAKLHRIGDREKYIAITRGPIVLTRDERLFGPHLEAILTPLLNDQGTIELTPVNKANPDIWMTFSARFSPESYAEYNSQPIDIELCDYASAGNAKNLFPFFKVWLPQLYDPRK